MRTSGAGWFDSTPKHVSRCSPHTVSVVAPCGLLRRAKVLLRRTSGKTPAAAGGAVGTQEVGIGQRWHPAETQEGIQGTEYGTKGVCQLSQGLGRKLLLV